MTFRHSRLVRGQLRPGDELIEIGGEHVSGRNPRAAVAMLAKADGQLEMRVRTRGLVRTSSAPPAPRMPGRPTSNPFLLLGSTGYANAFTSAPSKKYLKGASASSGDVDVEFGFRKPASKHDAPNGLADAATVEGAEDPREEPGSSDASVVARGSRV